MKRLHVGAFLLVLSCGAAIADDGVAVASGQAAVKSWLARVDAGDYGRSWDEASAVLKKAISRADWEKAAGSARDPLGKVTSRKQRSATFTRTLPGGAPEGEYVVLVFDTDLEKHSGGIETVTAAREKDGAWRVAGYYIR